MRRRGVVTLAPAQRRRPHRTEAATGEPPRALRGGVPFKGAGSSPSNLKQTDAQGMIKAVIFDVDGTLLDSVDLHAQSWVKSLAHFGVDVNVTEVRRHIGEGADRLMPAFLPQDTSQARKDEIEEFRAKVFKEQYLPLVHPFPKVRELLKRLKSDGLRIVLGSSCTAEEITSYKEIAGIADLIECETTSDDARH